jgi:hypothetical protein
MVDGKGGERRCFFLLTALHSTSGSSVVKKVSGDAEQHGYDLIKHTVTDCKQDSSAIVNEGRQCIVTLGPRVASVTPFG